MPVFISGEAITIKGLVEELQIRHADGELDGVGLIMIDPIYLLYEDGWEENSNEDTAQLARQLKALKKFSGIGTVFAHHHTKGFQDGKRDIEKASGGGLSDAWSRRQSQFRL